jgi:hypothetical protein
VGGGGGGGGVGGGGGGGGGGGPPRGRFALVDVRIRQGEAERGEWAMGKGVQFQVRRAGRFWYLFGERVFAILNQNPAQFRTKCRPKNGPKSGTTFGSKNGTSANQISKGWSHFWDQNWSHFWTQFWSHF